MKQSKVEQPISSPPLPPVPAGPRYRYFFEPPVSVSVALGDLATAISPELRGQEFRAERIFDLPAAEAFKGPVPKLSLGRLAELAPGCLRLPAPAGVEIRLPAAALAKAYRLVARQEIIEEILPPYAPPMESEEDKSDLPHTSSNIKDAPPSEKIMPEDAAPAPIPALPATENHSPAAERIPPPAPPILTEAKKDFLSEPPPSSETKKEVEKEDSAKPATQETPAIPSNTGEITPGTSDKPGEQAISPLAPPPLPVLEKAPEFPPSEKPAAPQSAQPVRRLFSMMPIFRRKTTNHPPAVVSKPAPVPEAPVKRPRVELPPPKVFVNPLSPLTEGKGVFSPETSFQPAPPVVDSASELPSPPAPSAKEEAPPLPEIPPPPPASSSLDVFPVPLPAGEKDTPPISEEKPRETPKNELPSKDSLPTTESKLVKTEPLSWEKAKPLTTGVPQLANQDDFQALFLTEEFLTVDRVIELCGGLPGINSCVLSHGSTVLTSHNVPDSIDLVSLSAHAIEMLKAMRESSARMGVGAVPAVTIHSEKGPITFFHQEDLCLLVLHKDRGFVPGVREKLQGVMDALVLARLPRPLPPSSPRILEG